MAAKDRVLSRFNRLQLDVFHALWNLYKPRISRVQLKLIMQMIASPPPRKRFRLFPIGITVLKEFGNKGFSDQANDYRPPYRRVKYEYKDREELSCRVLDRLARRTPGRGSGKYLRNLLSW